MLTAHFSNRLSWALPNVLGWALTVPSVLCCYCVIANGNACIASVEGCGLSRSLESFSNARCLAIPCFYDCYCCKIYLIQHILQLPQCLHKTNLVCPAYQISITILPIRISFPFAPATTHVQSNISHQDPVTSSNNSELRS